MEGFDDIDSSVSSSGDEGLFEWNNQEIDISAPDHNKNSDTHLQRKESNHGEWRRDEFIPSLPRQTLMLDVVEQYRYAEERIERKNAEIKPTRDERIRHLNYLGEVYGNHPRFLNICASRNGHDQVYLCVEMESWSGYLNGSRLMIYEMDSEIRVGFNNLKSEDEYLFASKLAEYYRYLMQYFCYVEILRIKYDSHERGLRILMYALEQVDLPGVETLGEINVYDLIDFVESYRGSDFKFFSNLQHLKNIVFTFDDPLFKPREIEDIEQVLPILEDIKLIHGCAVTIDAETSFYRMSDINTFLEMTSRLGIETNIKHGILVNGPTSCLTYFPPSSILLNNVSHLSYSVRNFKQLQFLLPSIKQLNNLQTLEVLINIDCLVDSKSFVSPFMDIFCKFCVFFNANNTNDLPSYKSLNLSIVGFGDDGIGYFSDEEENKICSCLFELIPKSLKFLSFNKIRNFTCQMADEINKKSSNIKYLFVRVEKTLEQDILAYFPNLKYFAFNSQTRITITSNIRVILHLPEVPYEVQYGIMNRLRSNIVSLDHEDFVASPHLRRYFTTSYRYICSHEFGYELFIDRCEYIDKHRKLLKFVPIEYKKKYYD